MKKNFSRYEQIIKNHVLDHLSKGDVQFHIKSYARNHPDFIRIVKRSIPYSSDYRAIVECIDEWTCKVTIVEDYSEYDMLKMNGMIVTVCVFLFLVANLKPSQIK